METAGGKGLRRTKLRGKKRKGREVGWEGPWSCLPHPPLRSDPGFPSLHSHSHTHTHASRPGDRRVSLEGRQHDWYQDGLVLEGMEQETRPGRRCGRDAGSTAGEAGLGGCCVWCG